MNNRQLTGVADSKYKLLCNSGPISKVYRRGIVCTYIVTGRLPANTLNQNGLRLYLAYKVHDLLAVGLNLAASATLLRIKLQGNGISQIKSRDQAISLALPQNAKQQNFPRRPAPASSLDIVIQTASARFSRSTLPAHLPCHTTHGLGSGFRVDGLHFL
jgi:hypothetical protein